MQKLSISFLGKDGPGIVATVSLALSSNNCNITQVTQSILGAEFAAIFIVEVPDDVTIDTLQANLEADLRKDRHDISVLIRGASSGTWSENIAVQPYVVTTDGPDGPGLIGAMARVFARHNINIENLKAILGHGGANHALFVLEVQVPESVDIGRLNREIQSAGREVGLNVSMQHRDIFEAMHRITDF
ncbi:MAG: ACT domain-containing protein [Desulfovibrionaceae bacterium]|nr:ACT domain-containing protein [Desulfovibrionaceae bacterium]